ncbi:MAG: SOS response-associated peptidase [Kangiellaceae bacterium]
MCGRMNVIDNPKVIQLCESLGFTFYTENNDDLRPSQSVACITKQSEQFQQINLDWGIKPSWSKKLIINAQSETTAIKKTFKSAFESNRCIIPVEGWYEWRDEGGKRKQKYYFNQSENEPLYMAGIWFSENNQLVTLTTRANEKCETIHKRMPVLIKETDFSIWLTSPINETQELFHAAANEYIQFNKSN